MVAKRSVSADEKHAHRRMIYLRERLPEVRTDLGKIRNERHDVLLKIKRASDDEERTSLNRRKIYLIQRAEVLKAEYSTLLAERKSIAAKTRGK